MLRVVLDSQQKWEEGTEISHMPPALHTCRASPIINISYQSGMFVAIGEPTLVHHYHPESIVYIRVYSQCGTFCGFGQMYSDMYPSLYHTDYFTALKILSSAYSYLPLSPKPGNHWSFYCLHIYPFYPAIYGCVNGTNWLLESNLHCFPSLLLHRNVFSVWIAVFCHHHLFESKLIFKASTSSMKQALISTLCP